MGVKTLVGGVTLINLPLICILCFARKRRLEFFFFSAMLKFESSIFWNIRKIGREQMNEATECIAI